MIFNTRNSAKKELPVKGTQSSNLSNFYLLLANLIQASMRIPKQNGENGYEEQK